MWSMIWPIALVVGVNVFYHITTKSTPEGVNAFASLAITYGVGAVLSIVMFYLTGARGLAGELGKTNWTAWVLGIAVVGRNRTFPRRPLARGRRLRATAQALPGVVFSCRDLGPSGGSGPPRHRHRQDAARGAVRVDVGDEEEDQDFRFLDSTVYSLQPVMFLLCSKRTFHCRSAYSGQFFLDHTDRC